jgi:hypothetical protein
VRSWTLDETGLDHLLLFDGGRLGVDGLRVSGLGRPLSVGQRLALQRRLARAEFLARAHLNR